MDREQWIEFSTVQASAEHALRIGRASEPQGLRVCQFLILPSFENPISWDVIEKRSGKECSQTLLYRTSWRMDLDSQSMSSPVERLKYPRPYKPTLESKWAQIDASKLEAILSQIRSVQIPLVPENPPMGCDGTSFELAFGEYFCNARIKWWCDMPEEWQELAPLVADLERLFECTWSDAVVHQNEAE